MQTIREILENKNKIAYKAKIDSSTYNPPVEEYFILKNKVDCLSSDTRLLIEEANPSQIDSHDPNRIVINIDGFKSEKINNARYLIKLVVYMDGNTVIGSHLVGMLNNTSKCYKRDLVEYTTKTSEVSYKKAKEIFE